MRLRTTTALALLAVPAIALSACGGKSTSTTTSSSSSASSASASSGSTPSIPAVTPAAADDIAGVTVGGTADKPTVKVDKLPFRTDRTTVKVLSQGSGATVAKSDTVSADVQFVSGKSGKVLEDTYSSGKPTTLPLPTTLPGLADGIVGQKAGSRVLVAMAPKDAAALLAQGGQAPVAADETLLAVVRIRPTEATGTPVAPKAGLPTVQFNHGKAATITVPKTPAPKSLVVQPLVQGNGPVVKAGQTVSVTYTGALYDGGKKFDSSFDHQPAAPFSTVIGKGQVIPAWDKAIVGAKVGSRLLVVAPASDAYGAKGSPPTIPANATLVFVVDVLDAS